jgi:RpiB/LacA/LacB family sugar-phosphate isomerase
MDKIIIGSDHAGWELKEAVKTHLHGKGIEVEDASEPVFDKNDDYPRYGFAVAKKVASGEFERGIAICGSGIGISIAVNRVRGVRGALCTTPEMARMSRLHNNSNVLVMGQKWQSSDVAFKMVDVWLATDFEGGRHERRITSLDP